MTTAPGIHRSYWRPMTQQEWAAFYGVGATQRGRGMTYFRGTQHQRGSGIGSLFSGLIRAVMPAAKSALKAVGREAMRTGVAVASDALAGQNVAQSLEHHGRQAAGKLVRKAGRRVVGSKRAKKKKGHGQIGSGFGSRLQLKPGKKVHSRRQKPINRGGKRRKTTTDAVQDYLNF